MSNEFNLRVAVVASLISDSSNNNWLVQYLAIQSELLPVTSHQSYFRVIELK